MREIKYAETIGQSSLDCHPWYRSEFPAWVAGNSVARCAEAVKTAVEQREKCVVDGTATCGGMPCEFHSAAVSFYGPGDGVWTLLHCGRDDSDRLAAKWLAAWEEAGRIDLQRFRRSIEDFLRKHWRKDGLPNARLIATVAEATDYGL